MNWSLALTSKKRKMFLVLGLLAASIILSDLGAEAQTKKKNRKKRTTTINFEDELIQGDIKKPELLYLLQKKQFNFKRLIKLRNNFIPEMYQTAEEIKDNRSND